MNQAELLNQVPEKVGQAVARYWATRSAQSTKQRADGKPDQGLRGAVTGGAQMDGFVDLFADLIAQAGIAATCIFRRTRVELPGFFRPTKEWDLLVVSDGRLVAVLEAKSQAGPSFGNNFNNRAEEAIGSAVDLWTAYREQAYLVSPQPFLGYLFMLEDCMAARKTVSVHEPHFAVLSEFVGASYTRRYEILCRKLVLERHYSAAAFITSSSDEGPGGVYGTPAPDLSVERFAKRLLAHLAGV